MGSPSANIARLTLGGRLTKPDLRAALVSVERSWQGDQPIPLLIDCRTMDGYESDARALFVQWNSENRAHISRVAVVTDRGLWHVVVSAMALASGQKLKAFYDWDEATSWLAEGGRDAPHGAASVTPDSRADDPGCGG
jgi:hypothetical protein